MKENLEIKIEREKRRYLDFAEKNREKKKTGRRVGKCKIEKVKIRFT